MRVSKLFMPTQREVPADAEIVSHQLMLRAGLMRKVASGVYGFLPLGYKAFRKVEAIVRSEMDKAGAQELIMPAILPAEVYIRSGRWDKFGPEMFRLKDRHGRDFCLGPTHEEPFTEAVRDNIKSYRQLPVTLYQIQHKYRDEKRPRFGVMRAREFVMKDAYSFDIDEAGLEISYKAMHKAYCNIFDRCNLDYILVDADSGTMGGSGSQEFMVTSAVGEDALAYCSTCTYAANEEKAVCDLGDKKTFISVDLTDLPSAQSYHDSHLSIPEKTKVHTPNIKTIEELTRFLSMEADCFVKTLIYRVDSQMVAVMIRGDREVNLTKLANLFDAVEVELADAQDVETITGATVGFAGPIGLKSTIPFIMDLEVAAMDSMVVGANETDYHFVHAKIGRDFMPEKICDIRTIQVGDPCPLCGAGVKKARGIEVGHIFKLGTKYSDALQCRFTDSEGQEKPMIMGCYGIGVGRTLAAIIEQNYDENGIKWPLSVAPYQVLIVPTNVEDKNISDLAWELHDQLEKLNIEVLIDDRNERPGVKFKDGDLIGIPLRVTVGRKAQDNLVEFKQRQTGEVEELNPSQVLAKIQELIRLG